MIAFGQTRRLPNNGHRVAQYLHMHTRPRVRVCGVYVCVCHQCANVLAYPAGMASFLVCVKTRASVLWVCVCPCWPMCCGAGACPQKRPHVCACENDINARARALRGKLHTYFIVICDAVAGPWCGRDALRAIIMERFSA